MNDFSGLIEKIRQNSLDSLQEIISIRRHLHVNPELSFKEFKTSDFIKENLKSMEIPFTEIINTGIIGIIEGKNPGKTIALRADMDALPIQETNEVQYKSIIPGIMHACGHDVHTASLLGASGILKKLSESFNGTIKLFFQPGEEKLPGGAKLMIEAGALKDPMPNAIFGQHVYNQLEAGQAGFREGIYMASTDEIYLRVIGKGGHAAMPSTYVNPLLIASGILLDLNEKFRTLDPSCPPTVLAFGKIKGDGATNVIPDEVYIEGTFRTFDENWRKEAHEIIRTLTKKIASQMGGKCNTNIVTGYPFLVNDPPITKRAKNVAKMYLGKENVFDLDIRMTAEDFAYFSQNAPSCFYRLGTGNKSKNITSNVHTSNFDIDEASLATGMGLMAALAINELMN